MNTHASDLGRHHVHMVIEQVKQFRIDCRTTADAFLMVGTLGAAAEAVILHTARGDKELYDLLHKAVIDRLEEQRRQNLENM